MATFVVGVIQQPRLKIPQRQSAVAAAVPQQPPHVQRGDGGWLLRQRVGESVKAAEECGNREWRTEEWRTESGEQKSGEQKVENRKWRTESGEQKVENIRGVLECSHGLSHPRRLPVPFLFLATVPVGLP